MLDSRALREIMTMPPFTFQFNRNLKTEDWKDIDQALQLHQLPKDLFQWSIDNISLNLESPWEELGESCPKICLKEIPFIDLMEITKGWNPSRHFRCLEERTDGIRENQANNQAIEEQLNHKEHTLIPSGSQVVNQPDSPVSSHHSGTRKSVTKSHHSSQYQVVSRRRGGLKARNKISFRKSQKKSDPIIQKLLDLVKELHKSQK
ncbi:hypothetical protein O181_130507 [Austropuccinia psidii MF-1]|uniref:Uncharacterized protein n=1 Tax=Austropuccinia psidii MF-1 TaxID=1389203 RepID=A0A9Q3L3X8_9BASI|nr:hypothetical protein [Austropuccinia psidii MF-1]